MGHESGSPTPAVRLGAGVLFHFHGCSWYWGSFSSARLGMAARARGFDGTCRLCVGLALALPVIKAVTFIESAPSDVLLTGPVLLEIMIIHAVLRREAATGVFWWPVRPLAEAIQEFFRSSAQASWKEIQRETQSRLDKLNRRERRQARRALSQWQSPNTWPA